MEILIKTTKFKSSDIRFQPGGKIELQGEAQKYIADHLRNEGTGESLELRVLSGNSLQAVRKSYPLGQISFKCLILEDLRIVAHFEPKEGTITELFGMFYLDQNRSISHARIS